MTNELRTVIPFTVIPANAGMHLLDRDKKSRVKDAAIDRATKKKKSIHKLLGAHNAQLGQAFALGAGHHGGGGFVFGFGV